MQMNFSPGLGLLPEPERNLSSFLTSSAINGAILGVLLIVGMTARHAIQQQYETTELIVPTQPPPPIKVKPPVMPKMPPPPQTPKLEMEAPKIQVQQPKPPEPKPVQMEAKVTLPTVKAAKPQIILAPQPKAALTAAMPAQNPQVHPSTAPVHLGQTFGATPNPNASPPGHDCRHRQPLRRNAGAGGCAPRCGGFHGHRQWNSFGSNAGTVGRVASAGIPGATGTSNSGSYWQVASAGIPTAAAAPAMRQQQEQVQSTSNLKSYPSRAVQYTSEARALHVEGDVILRVTFLASGQVVVHGVVHGLGHGLDEEARRVAEQIRFRPATQQRAPGRLDDQDHHYVPIGVASVEQRSN